MFGVWWAVVVLQPDDRPHNLEASPARELSSTGNPRLARRRFDIL
jgi:hypothetical protein